MVNETVNDFLTKPLASDNDQAYGSSVNLVQIDKNEQIFTKEN